MKKRGVVGWVVFLLVIAAAFVVYWRFFRSAKAAPIDYKTVTVEKRRIVGKVTASGTLQATVTVQVGTQVSGRIQKLNADFNSQVKKGDLIAKIDPQLFQATVAQAHANYASAQANVVKAQAQVRDAEMQFNRIKALFDQNLASAADLQTAQTTLAVNKASVDVAKASVEQAAASLSQAQVNLNYCNIYSPIDGTVISRSVDVGQTVAASLSAPTLFTIAEDLKKMQVNTNISEGDVGRLEAGMAAYFTVDAFPGQRFRGKISQIRNAAQTVQNVVTYDAVIDVDNSDLKLRPGMTANVTITYAQRDEVLAVPNAALRFRPPPEVTSAAASASASASAVAANAPSAAPSGSARRRQQRGNDTTNDPKPVWILRGGVAMLVQIKLGLTDGTYTEVVDGEINEGDLVITDANVVGKTSTPAATQTATMRRMF